VKEGIISSRAERAEHVTHRELTVNQQDPRFYHVGPQLLEAPDQNLVNTSSSVFRWFVHEEIKPLTGCLWPPRIERAFISPSDSNAANIPCIPARG
jgi:hypothetical protein